MKIYDITRTISPEIAVWPGDQKFESKWTMEISKGSSVNLSSITMSAHTGTHADAPYHYLDDGKFIADLPLEKFVGPAIVIEIPDVERVEMDHVAHVDFSRIQRLLFKTKSSALDDSTWIEDIVVLGTDTAEYLGKMGVQLVGMDAPSVDGINDSSLSTHKMLGKHEIVNLENLLLKEVPPGEYQLIALPLKFKGLDASPIRAILIEGQ
jgi:arylformamidase